MQPGLAAFLTAFLYEIISTLPYRIIAYYPFRKQLRFSTGMTVFIIGFTQLLESTVYARLAPENAFMGRIAEYTFAVICFMIYMNTVKINRWKILFIYIFLFVTSFCLTILSSYAGLLFSLKHACFTAMRLPLTPRAVSF
ncbi:MAG: hypothetical protein LIP12_16335 [Clostridiales bacterium]|nr:hypothetical protein [Clostridiales bacterium]